MPCSGSCGAAGCRHHHQSQLVWLNIGIDAGPEQDKRCRHRREMKNKDGLARSVGVASVARVTRAAFFIQYLVFSLFISPSPFCRCTSCWQLEANLQICYFFSVRTPAFWGVPQILPSNSHQIWMWEQHATNLKPGQTLFMLILNLQCSVCGTWICTQSCYVLNFWKFLIF